MEPSQSVNTRDPVCGMAVAAGAQTPSVVVGQQTYLFCALGCKESFLAEPARYVRPTLKQRPRAVTQLVREASIVAVVLVLSVGVIALARGRNDAAPAVTPGSTVTGTAAGQDQAVDNGANSVIVSATFERAASSDREAVFSVSLNTHSIDLSAFDPAAQMVLRTKDGQESNVETVSRSGEQSSHHQNYRVSFARPAAGSATLVVRDVSGIAERLLTFTL